MSVVGIPSGLFLDELGSHRPKQIEHCSSCTRIAGNKFLEPHRLERHAVVFDIV